MNDEIEFVTYQPTFSQIEKTVAYNVIVALENGVEWVQEALMNHDFNYGRTTRSNEATAKMIERDIEKMKTALEQIRKIKFN